MYLASIVQLGGVENFWLVYMFRIGLFGTIILSFLFYKLFKRLLNGYSTFNKIFVVTVFVLIASTNNSISTATPAISAFILCILCIQSL